MSEHPVSNSSGVSHVRPPSRTGIASHSIHSWKPTLEDGPVTTRATLALLQLAIAGGCGVLILTAIGTSYRRGSGRLWS